MTTETRTNLYKIVDNTQTPESQTVAPIGRRQTPKEKVTPFFQTPLRMLRWMVFHMLMWIRPFFHLATRIVAVPCFIVGIVGFIAVDAKHEKIPYIFMGLSFGAFLLGWFYDTAILKISPEPIILS